nr:Flp family type IVb pilin [uncultured Cohaesibacter sp.]
MKKFSHFLKDESGATAIEYALLAGLIGVGIVASVTLLRDAIIALFTRIGTQLGAIAP